MKKQVRQLRVKWLLALLLVLLVSIGGFAAQVYAVSQSGSGSSSTCFGNGKIACTCSYAALDPHDWLQINVIVIGIALLIAALVYSISSLLPTITRERVRGAVKTEGAEAIVALIIILAILGFSGFTCGLVAQLTSNLAPARQSLAPFQFADYYVGTLLFTQGTGLVQQLYYEGIKLVVDANLLDAYSILLGQISGGGGLNLFGGTLQISTSFQPNIAIILYSYATIYAEIYGTLIVVTFGLLLLLFLMLPIIQATALTVVVPLALIMRVIPFGGPRLRQASDSFLAIAIAFYFVLPLALVFNAAALQWAYTPCGNGVSTGCNPYASYLGNYQLSNIPENPFFQANNIDGSQLTQGLGGLSLPLNFFGNLLNPQLFFSILSMLFTEPTTAFQLGLETAQYLFQGVVLLAIDTAIIVGFAQGLARGLGSLGGIIGSGPFWSG